MLLDAGPQQVGTAMRAALDDGATPFELGLKVNASHQPTVDEFATLSTLRSMNPRRILSAHLPPAQGRTRRAP